MTTLAELMVGVGVDLDDLESGAAAGVRSFERSMDRIEADAEHAGRAIDDAGDMAAKAFDGIDPAAREAGTALDRVADDADRVAREVEGSGDRAGGGFLSGMRGGLDGIGGVASGAMDKFKTVAMAGAAAAGLAIGALVVTGMATGLDTEVATDRLAAQLGGSDWAYSMGDIAGSLYTDGFGDSAAETGAAIRSVLEKGLASADSSTDAEIESITERLLTFTDVLEQDMDMAAQAVSTMLRSGIAKDGAAAFDVLTRGVQEGADKAGDLLETFQEYSPAFREVGIDASDATGLMVQGLQAGARDADKVADALKEFGIRAQDGSEASAEGFKLIGLSASEMTAAVAEGGPAARSALDQVLDGLRGMEDPVQRNAAAVALFGTQAEDLGDALFALDLDTATAGLGNIEGATDKLGSAYDNASTKIETFKRKALDVLVRGLGGQVIPALEEAGDWASEHLLPAFEDVGDWITSDGVSGLRDFAGWLGDELGPAASDFADSLQEDVLPAARSFGEFLGRTVVPAVQKLGEFILGTAVPALISFAGWLAEHERVLAAVAIAVGALMLPALAGLVVAFGAWAVSAAAAAAATLVAMAPIILIGAAIAAFAYLVITHWDTIVAATKAAFGFVVNLISGAIDWVRNNWPLLLAILTGPFGLAVLAISRNWESIKAGATAVKDWIVARFNDVVSFVTGLPDAIASAVVGLFDAIPEGFKSAINKVIGWWNGLSFPSFDIPSVSVPGLGSFGGGSIGGWDLPNITPLAEGGIVPATPGGMFAQLGEGRHDEAVIPLPRGLRAMGQSMGTPLIGQLVVQGSIHSERDLIDLIRDAVERGDFGGAFAA